VVADQSEQLASEIEKQNAELAHFFAGCTDADLRRPCADPSGATVAAVLGHLSEGYDLVLGWLARTTGSQVAVPAGGEADDLHAYAERLAAGGRAWATLTSGLDDAQLGTVPPATPDITDGTKPLGSIISHMIEHQSIHLNYVKDAVTGVTGASGRTA